MKINVADEATRIYMHLDPMNASITKGTLINRYKKIPGRVSHQQEIS